MYKNDLKWVIDNGNDEVDYYLENVTTEQFINDVRELMKKNTTKTVIQEAISNLQKYL